MNLSSTGEKCARGLLLLVLFAAPAALAAAEGDTWIVFECNRPNPESDERTYWDIWKLDPDANDWDQTGADCDLFGDPLTTDPANEWDPTYSAVNQSVVFVSDKDGWPHLWKVSIDGGYWEGFLFGQYSTVDPCYSFDGTKIAYASNQNGNWDIFVMDTSGYDKTQITTNSGDDRSPCFSTDGTKIYFISNRDAGQIGDWEIYVVNAGGGTASKAIVNSSGQALLLNYTEHDPCCSPTDDDIIVFATNKATPTYTEQVDRINFELWEYSISGKNITRLTESWNDAESKQMWNSSMPCFSPDGERIAWSADNWTSVSWQKHIQGRPPYDPSYWKPDDRGQGSSHQIWTRELNQTDHCYWFSPSTWGYSGGEYPGRGYWEGGHQHHKHYNPSWDEQP
ncbi:hypothetical protein GF359_06695 [candidate division WOR-3 bacterium]|uniref:Dipeptidylpeptidase IV N-terminal domain-containing protein n=1 Tax=candidate division WOR-3 bacterium TaxID=2052148 RepID=A0A9D5QDB7_UNCW3|nr:hypothetical protein [candidate division WOR-3 bacterium]MBD3364886.1 hypothetical protein [candidate division WOR-3 bacterium]